MIEEKLKILKDNNVIDANIEEKVLQAGEILIEKEIITELDEADVFLTHLAMAVSRDEKINEADDTIKNQLESHEAYDQAKELWLQLQKDVDIKLDDFESDYMYMHLLTLLQ